MARYWYVSTLNKKYLSRVEKELSTKKYLKKIQVFIPSLVVIRKKTRGDYCSEEVPLLFDYGFFRIPKDVRLSTPNIFESIIRDISCVTGWLPDKNKRFGIAKVHNREIKVMMASENHGSVYDRSEVDNIFRNELIELKGHTYGGIIGRVILVDKIRQEVEVELQLSPDPRLNKTVRVDFCNVFNTIYQGGYDDSLSSVVSLDELAERKTNKLDRVLSRHANEPEYDFPVSFESPRKKGG